MCRIQTDLIALDTNNLPFRNYPNSIVIDHSNTDMLVGKTITYEKGTGDMNYVFGDYVFSYKKRGNYKMNVFVAANKVDGTVKTKYEKFSQNFTIFDGNI